MREAQEEVAIPPEAVEVIGVLPPSGQRHRFSGDAGGGHYSPNLHYHASQDEVSAVFEMPSPKPLRLGRATIRSTSTVGVMTTASGSPGTSIILSGE
ncbi:hypothetical protein LNO36_18610 [Klebsiella variicola subsp. variicola]|nr:hypothetical protein [Klebsiella variicola subsp. variicola]